MEHGKDVNLAIVQSGVNWGGHKLEGALSSPTQLW